MLLAIALSAVLSPRDLTAAERAVIRTAVEAELKDPGSAQFKWNKWNRGMTYCGMLNAKNAYGGYTGFAPFLAIIDEAEGPATWKPVVMISDNNGAVATVVAQQCAEAGYPAR